MRNAIGILIGEELGGAPHQAAPPRENAKGIPAPSPGLPPRSQATLGCKTEALWAAPPSDGTGDA